MKKSITLITGLRKDLSTKNINGIKDGIYMKNHKILKRLSILLNNNKKYIINYLLIYL